MTAAVTLAALGNVSAINVSRSTNQRLSANTYTKFGFNTEVYDTKNEYDNSTNYRFTPVVAGYYLITSQLTADGTLTNMGVYVYKNGTRFYDGNNNHSSSYYNSTNVSVALYLNGSTDYIEIYAQSSAGGSIQGGAAPNVSWFTSNFIGAA
jgi:hypothetical protein